MTVKRDKVPISPNVVKRIRLGLRRFLAAKDEAKLAEALKQDKQKSMVALMRSVDPNDETKYDLLINGQPHTFDVVQNKAGFVVDPEALADLIDSIPGMRDKVSTLVLDQAKIEAEIAAGNIPQKKFEAITTPGARPAPYIRVTKR